MKTKLYHNFLQVTLLSLIGLVSVTNLIASQSLFTIEFLWRLLGIGGGFGFTFGVLYPYLWQYGTLKASWNIVLSTLINFATGCLSVLAYSSELFAIVRPFLGVILLVTLLLHWIFFDYYRRRVNQQLVAELNRHARK